MAEFHLQAQALSCMRGERLLWKDIQFQMSSGQLLQITGGNGCGKTSLLKILAGLAKPHTGAVTWQGRSIENPASHYQQHIHYLSHHTSVKNALTVKENLYLNLKNKVADHHLLPAIAQVGLTPYLNHFGYQLSQGQKQRLALARLLVSSASLWILDEPLTALDAQMMEEIQLTFINQLQRGGMIILTTHRPLTQKNLVHHTLMLEYHECA